MRNEEITEEETIEKIDTAMYSLRGTWRQNKSWKEKREREFNRLKEKLSERMHMKLTEIVSWYREERKIEEQECKDKSDSREEK